MSLTRTRAEKLDTLQQLEVAEGVDVTLRPAGPVPRILAYGVDCLIRGGILTLLIIPLVILGFFGSASSLLVAGVGLLVMFVIEWTYGAYFESREHGATWGKRLMGLRVVRASGVPMTVGAALLRNLLRTVDSAPSMSGLVGVGVMLFSKRFQRLGDMVADTLVVYQEPRSSHRASFTTMPTNQPPSTATPPPVRLTREEQQAFVQFEERCIAWTMPRRIEMANHLTPLTQQQGPAAVERVLETARWIRES